MHDDMNDRNRIPDDWEPEQVDTFISMLYELATVIESAYCNRIHAYRRKLKEDDGNWTGSKPTNDSTEDDLPF